MTNAIVAAAKRVRKSKAAVEPELPSIVDEVNTNYLAGNFTQEAIANLSRVFGREFVVEEETEPKVLEPPSPAKKPRVKKVKTTTVPEPEPIVGGSVVEETEKPKKPRASKAKKPEETVSAEVPDSKPVEEEPKKKSRAPKAKKEAAPAETEAVKETKVKKPRAKKPVADVSGEIETPAPERPSTPVLVEDDTQTDTDSLPDLTSRMNLTKELEEEELSDIED